MSVDKLVDSAQLESDLTSVADAIRTKTGGTADLAFPADFVSEIGSISGGGGDHLAEALNNTLTSYTSADVTTIRSYGFASMNIHNVSVPNCTIINAYAFSSCSNLQGIVLPSVKQVNGGAYMFNGCSALAYADFGDKYATVGSAGIAIAFFSNCTALKTLILRTTSKVVPLSVSTALNGSPFASDKSGGTLYVPSALISSYQSATNWSTILGYANNSIKAIEGSQYENYYADGTPIPTT